MFLYLEHLEPLYTCGAMLGSPSGKNIAIATNYQQLFDYNCNKISHKKITVASAIATFVS